MNADFLNLIPHLYTGYELARVLLDQNAPQTYFALFIDRWMMANS